MLTILSSISEIIWCRLAKGICFCSKSLNPTFLVVWVFMGNTGCSKALIFLCSQKQKRTPMQQKANVYAFLIRCVFVINMFLLCSRKGVLHSEKCLLYFNSFTIEKRQKIMIKITFNLENLRPNMFFPMFVLHSLERFLRLVIINELKSYSLVKYLWKKSFLANIFGCCKEKSYVKCSLTCDMGLNMCNS